MTLLNLALTLAALTHAHAAPTVVEIPAHPVLADAVETNNQLGRDEWDAYSVHYIREFAVLTPGSHAEIIQEVIAATAADRQGILRESCYFIHVVTSKGCAQTVLQNNWQDNWHIDPIKLFLTRIQRSEEDEQDIQVFNNAIQTILAHVKDAVGQNYKEYRADISWINVDGGIHILISEDGKKVLLVGVNEGA